MSPGGEEPAVTDGAGEPVADGGGELVEDPPQGLGCLRFDAEGAVVGDFEVAVQHASTTLPSCHDTKQRSPRSILFSISRGFDAGLKRR